MNGVAPTKSDINAGLTLPSSSSTSWMREVRHHWQLFVWGLAARCLHILQPIYPPDWVNAFASGAVRSILIDPHYTLTQVREARAVRALFASTSSSSNNAHYQNDFARSYQLRTIALPPLLLKTIESVTLMDYIFVSETTQDMLLGMITLVVDLVIAERLYRLAAQTLLLDTRDDDGTTSHHATVNKNAQIPRADATIDEINAWERHWEQQLPERIQPPPDNIFAACCAAPAAPPKESKSETLPSAFLCLEAIPSIIAKMYWANPAVALASPISFASLRVLFILLALNHAAAATRSPDASASFAGICVALAMYMELSLGIMLIPIMLLVAQRQRPGHYGKWAMAALAFGAASIYLSALEYTLTGIPPWTLWQWRQQASVRQARPSLSVRWYFEMLVFPRFRPYLVVLLSTLPYIPLLPLALRLHRYPGVLVAVYWLIFAICRSTTTLYEMSLAFCLFLLSPKSLARMAPRKSLVAVLALPIPVGLYLAMHPMWLHTNNGEANFLFFQCLVYNIFGVVLLLEFTSASLQHDKALRMVAKQECASVVAGAATNGQHD